MKIAHPLIMSAMTANSPNPSTLGTPAAGTPDTASATSGTPDLINQPYPLTEQQITRFADDGFIKLPDVFDQLTLDTYAPTITQLTFARNPNKDVDLTKLDTYGQAFIQVTNLWRISDEVRRFTFSKRLAGIAAALLGTAGVRMYHDQALYKEPAGGFTPWHADQQYWPLTTSRSVTAWIPLHAVPIEMGPLCFARGSHQKKIGRELEISDDSEKLIEQQIKGQGLIEVQEPFALGEVSFHLGWTLHRAGPNTTDHARKVQTVIYIDRDMRLAEPKNQNQQNDWETWSPGTQVGDVMADELNPVLYEASNS
jgi:hypothetical protein